MCARGHVRRHNTLSRHLKLVFVCEEKGGKLFYETYALLEGCCISLIRGGGGGGGGKRGGFRQAACGPYCGIF